MKLSLFRILVAVFMALFVALAALPSAKAGPDPQMEELTRRLLSDQYYLVGISDGFINQYTSRIRFYSQGDKFTAEAHSGVPESYRLGVTDLRLNYPNLYFTVIATDPKGKLLAVRDCRAAVSGDLDRIPYTCLFMIGPEQARAAPQKGELVRDTGQAVVMFEDPPAQGCFLSTLTR
jgi:hypothetical protein